MVTIEEGGLRVVRGTAAGTAGAQTDARRVCVSVRVRGACLLPSGDVRVFPYVLLTIWSRSPFLNDKSEAVRDS